MNTLIQAIRWYNLRCPWNQHKHRLTRLAERQLDRGAGMKVYDGIAGSLRMSLDLSNRNERCIYLNINELVIGMLVRRLLRPGDCFVDAGANIGMFTLQAASAVGPTGRVFAFEPHPRTVERLRENIALNGFKHVEIVERGCWSEPGTFELFDFEGCGSGMASMRQRQTKAIGAQHTIRTVKIDEVVDRPVRMIKVDVEGAQFEAMKGAEQLLCNGTPPHLVIELHKNLVNQAGHHPMELVDWILERQPDYQLNVIGSRRTRRINRDALERELSREGQSVHDVWFQPTNDARRR